jgi:hypothetical protein
MLLDGEEKEILSALGAGENADLRIALGAAQMKTKLSPSHRGQGDR